MDRYHLNVSVLPAAVRPLTPCPLSPGVPGARGLCALNAFAFLKHQVSGGEAAAFRAANSFGTFGLRMRSNVCRTHCVGSQVASLARFGKPSDYGEPQLSCCEFARKVGAFSHAFARLPNVLCRFTSRFARSVWKTERLFRLRCRLVDCDRQWSHALSDLELDASGIHLGIFATKRRRFACG